MGDNELSIYLNRFYKFASEFVRRDGDPTRLVEIYEKLGNDMEFAVLSRHIAAMRARGGDGVSLWDLSSMIQDSMMGIEVSQFELRKAWHRAFLELVLFDESIREEFNDSDLTKGSQIEIMATIRECGRRLTTEEVFTELEKKNRIWGQSTVKNELAALRALRRLDNKRGSGYGIPGWP